MGRVESHRWFFHDTGLKSRLVDDVGRALRFIIASIGEGLLPMCEITLRCTCYADTSSFFILTVACSCSSEGTIISSWLVLSYQTNRCRIIVVWWWECSGQTRVEWKKFVSYRTGTIRAVGAFLLQRHQYEGGCFHMAWAGHTTYLWAFLVQRGITDL